MTRLQRAEAIHDLVAITIIGLLGLASIVLAVAYVLFGVQI